MDLPLAGGGTEAGVQSPQRGNCLSQRRNIKAERETADLWQPKWNENQTVLAAAIRTPDRDTGHLDGATAGSWSLGIAEQSQGEGCCWLWREQSRGCEGGDCDGKRLWRKAGRPWKQGDSAESCVGGGAIATASLPPHASTGSWKQGGRPVRRLTTELQITTASLPPHMPALGAENRAAGPSDASPLNSRVGPQPGGPPMCLTCLTAEKDPRQGN